MAVVLQVENKKSFSSFPEEMEKYFLGKDITVKIIPADFLPELRRRYKDVKITSAKQLANFIDEELSFWGEKDTKNIFSDITKITTLRSAKTSFENAAEQFRMNQPSSGRNALAQCISALSGGVLYSKTTLAKYMVENLTDASSEVIRGFKCGLLKSKNSSLQSITGDYEGFLWALQFRKIINQLTSPSEEEIARFCENADIASEQYAKLNAQYLESFYDQETRISNFVEQINGHFEETQSKTDDYFASTQKRVEELEKLYKEKLRLKAPAEYWNALEKEYAKKGRLCFGVAIVSSLLIVAFLLSTIAFLPNLFPEDSHWFEVFRNSAILTVITSVLVYLVRYFMKIAMSSFHLARDAKERENLSHFYLALIEEGAVSDKERAIVLNALFSRSDSGLLKGDSAPTMSNTPSELVELLKSKP